MLSSYSSEPKNEWQLPAKAACYVKPELWEANSTSKVIILFALIDILYVGVLNKKREELPALGRQDQDSVECIFHDNRDTAFKFRGKESFRFPSGGRKKVSS